MSYRGDLSKVEGGCKTILDYTFNNLKILKAVGKLTPRFSLGGERRGHQVAHGGTRSQLRGMRMHNARLHGPAGTNFPTGQTNADSDMRPTTAVLASFHQEATAVNAKLEHPKI